MRSRKGGMAFHQGGLTPYVSHWSGVWFPDVRGAGMDDGMGRGAGPGVRQLRQLRRAFI